MKLKNNRGDSKIFKVPSTSGFHSYLIKFMSALGENPAGTEREAGLISFAYKDYATGNTQKQMTLNCDEFIRRFAQHILPKCFTKIRTYGYLANRNRQQRINAILQQMKLPQHKGLVKVSIDFKLKERFGINMYECPCCKQITLELLKVYGHWKQADDG